MDENSHELLLPLVNEENICLPLPINAVAKYWNIQLPLSEAKEIAKKYSGFTGSVIIEGIESAERHGLVCKIVNSSLNELKKIIDIGIPPIVILPGIPEVTQHASVITGYNPQEKTILHYIQTGNQEGEIQEGAIPEKTFGDEWSQENFLMILISPPDILEQIKLDNEISNKSNRLCFESERQNILKNFSEAFSTLNEAIQISNQNPTANHLIATMMNEQKQSDCVKYYQKCLELNHNFYLSYNGLGNFYLKTNDFKNAEKNYSKAIEINPKRSAKIYKNRAYVREKNNAGTDLIKDDLKNYLKYNPKASDRGIIEQAIREI